jgi:hypothetical protein
MTTLPKPVFDRVVSVLEQHFDVVAERRAIVKQALYDSTELLGHIEYEGSARQFTASLVQKCDTYGRLRSGQLALEALLAHVRDSGLVGINRQREINDLISQVVAASQSDDESQFLEITEHSRLSPTQYGLVYNRNNRPLTVWPTPHEETQTKHSLRNFQTFRVVDRDFTDEIVWLKVDYGDASPGWVAEVTITQGELEYNVRPFGLSLLSGEKNCSSRYFFGMGSGCPDDLQRSVTGAHQLFEYGCVIWRLEPDEFYILYSDGEWEVYQASYVKELKNANPNEHTPPDLRMVPTSGFGRIWNLQNVRKRLGWALAAEEDHQIVFQNVDPDTYEMSSPITYISLPHEHVAALCLGSEKRTWHHVKKSS